MAPRQTGGRVAFQTILYSVDEAIATIALNRPDKLNAMNNQIGRAHV